MTEIKRPKDGDRFTVQVFWLALIAENTLYKMTHGPYTDWLTARAERDALPNPDDHVIVRSDSTIEVDNNRSTAL